MTEIWNETLLKHYMGSMDMLRNAIKACPDELWFDRDRFPEFWYVTYHTLFFHDYYLSESPESFAPPEPFNLDELDPAGILPEEPFDKETLLSYLEHGRQKCVRVINEMTDEWAAQTAPFRAGEFKNGELLLNNLRHSQHHTAQLNLLLRQVTNSAAPRWVGNGNID